MLSGNFFFNYALQTHYDSATIRTRYIEHYFCNITARTLALIKAHCMPFILYSRYACPFKNSAPIPCQPGQTTNGETGQMLCTDCSAGTSCEDPS